MMDNLGTLDLERYLAHYGRGFTVKVRGEITSYILDECPFDPNHRGGEARIDSSPNPPFLTFSCFHNSCHGRTWKEARARISGSDAISQFFPGYDASKAAPAREETNPLEAMKLASLSLVDLGVIRVTLPEIDPLEFYEGEGARKKYQHYEMAGHVIGLLGNLLHTEGQFWIYQGGVYRKISTHLHREIIIKTLRKHVQPNNIDGTIKVIAGIVNRDEKAWPRNSELLNCRNGMLDLRTAKLLPHDPGYGSRMQIASDYDMDAEYPEWDKFLKEVFPGEPEKIDLLQEFFGYCLLGDCRFQKALFLYGSGANGKSTVLNVLREMIGPENCSSLEISALDDKFATYFLENKMVNISTETTSRTPLALEVFKKAVAGEALTAERKYGEKYEFLPNAKFLVAMNDLPVITDKTPGFGRRVIVLEFNRRFTPEEQNPNLMEKLRPELNGILAWALLGYGNLMARGRFAVPQKVMEAGERFQKALNPLLIWAEERALTEESKAELKKTVWDDYVNWCKECGHRPLARSHFFYQLQVHFPQLRYGYWTEDRQRRMHVIGLELKPKE